MEVGFYQDPYSDFGRLTYEMWPACRLVVDTGMHAKSWSRQKATDFMVDNTSLSVHNIKTGFAQFLDMIFSNKSPPQIIMRKRLSE